MFQEHIANYSRATEYIDALPRLRALQAKPAEVQRVDFVTGYAAFVLTDERRR